jgi:Spx/MgsR family transcriptional regulator
MVTIYGIRNCDTIKKARRWLEANNVDYRFHDYRADGISADMLDRFEQSLGWQALLNTRGTTWRKLSDAERDNINQERALALLLKHPAMIKRPVLEVDDRLLLGFSETDYQQALNP